MAFYNLLVLLLVSVLGSGQCLVCSHEKCSIKDNECQRDFVAMCIYEGKGFPEKDIPQIDPAVINNLHVGIPELIDITITDGTIKGMSKCTVTKFETNIEKLHSKMHMTCDKIVAKGQYDLHSDNPAIKTLLGGEITGKGNGKIVIENLSLKFLFPFQVVKKDNKIYLPGDINKFKFTYDVQGKIEFGADNLVLGGKESSKEIVAIMNENWKIVLNTFGNQVLDITMKNYVYKFIKNFFTLTPAEEYITEDLSSYVE